LIERVARDLGDPLRAGVSLHDAVGRVLTKGVSRDAHQPSLTGQLHPATRRLDNPWRIH
jgi:hypothetical protein